MPQQYMSLELFRRILDRLPAGQHVVCLQGEGEPTIHPQFWEMVDMVRARNHIPYTITNGSRIDVEKVAANFPRVGISIDTLDPEEAERIGRKKLAKVLANIDKLVEAMGPGRITIMTVDYGQPLGDLNVFLSKVGIRDHIVQPLQIKDDYRYRYPEHPRPAAAYTYRCRYLENPLHLTFGLDGRDYPCCYIKNPQGYESAAQLRADLARKIVPECCSGCREILADVAQPVRGGETSAMAPRLSLIVPVRGRLDHLKQALPQLVKQADSEVIVVDYDCPEGSAQWVQQSHPQVCIVKVTSAPIFNLARARNLGASVARGEWLGFINADVVVADAFVASITNDLVPGNTLIPPPVTDLGGVIVCKSSDFRAIDGYDELFEGWACEDDDLRVRLLMLGRRAVEMSANHMTPIPHRDEQRWAYYRNSDKWLDLRINGLYLQIKSDLARQLGPSALSADVRRTIYAEVRKAVTADPDQVAQITVNLPQGIDFTQPPGWELSRTMVYRFLPKISQGAGISDNATGL